MERTDLLNALRLVRDYCYGRDDCGDCIMASQCNANFKENTRTVPENWDLDDDV